VPHDVVRDAAEEEAPHRPAVVGADHDEVGRFRLRRLDDRFACVAVPGHAGRVRAHRPGALDDGFDRQLALRAHGRRPGHDGQDEQPRAQPRGKLHGVVLGGL
jgi:hypothetical protein